MAGALVPHLRLLLRAPGGLTAERSRIVVLAGAILALVTAAIPLQLEDEWVTVGWACFAVGLLVAGIAVRSRPGRIAAIALLAVTVVKGFLLDLGRLDGLYRVASFVGLAVSLALVLQRFALSERSPGSEA